MRFEGKVTNKTENEAGHSQVRISATAEVEPGGAEPVEVILSTPSGAVIGAFKVGQKVSFDL